MVSMKKQIPTAVLAVILVLLFPALQAQTPQERALSRMDQIRESYELSENDLNDLVVHSQYPTRHSGVSHVYLRQRFQGIEIYQANASFAIDRNGKVYDREVSFVKGIADKVNSLTPDISASDAIEAFASELGLPAPQALSLLTSPVGVDQAQTFSEGGISFEPIPAKLVFQPVDNELRLAWEITVYPLSSDHMWNGRIDASTGKLLHNYDWVTSCKFDHPHPESPAEPAYNFAAPEPLPLPKLNAPDSYTVFPEPVESPSHGVRATMIDPAVLAASPFGWHDTNGAAGAEFTITRGNNVLAQEDLNGNNGTGASPDGGASLDFNPPLNLNAQPTTYTNAAVVNLFYWNNLIHDVLYGYGFDDPAGNFQENNYGRGGAGSDFVNADAQDGSGTNNANFGTPPDGGNPRMQMFLWNGSSTTIFDVNSPAVIAGNYNAVEAQFGPGLSTTPITGNLVLADDGSANPTEACNAIANGAAMSGNIALIDRANCTFVTKVQNAENAGAVACVVCNNVAGAPFAMGGATGAITIPSIMISQADCNLIKAQLGSGVNVSLSNTGGAFDKDGDFDNGIIAHEYGHGVSNRLTGGPNNTSCLGNAEQMGEGWSDFLGLWFTIEPGDQSTDVRGIGTYAISQAPSGGGIRPAPYSTDLNINPFTYGDITNTATISRPHGIGFLWCNMLWEMTWSFIAQYGFDTDLVNGTGGNNLAMRLVLDGMKLQPCNPGFVDGRDAILLADTLLTGGANGCLIWEAFAKRGLGLSSSQGSSNNRSDGNEAFDIPVCTFFPVEWLSIDATPRSTDIALNWSLAQESNNRGFEIERRVEGNYNFQNIGFVASNGSSDKLDYGFIDSDVDRGVPYFYRLKQIDNDGTVSYSPIVSATLEGLQKISLFPNPSSGVLNVQVTGTEVTKARISISNLLGQQFLLTEAELPQNGLVKLDINSLASGVYLVKVVTDNGVAVERLVKE